MDFDSERFKKGDRRYTRRLVREHGPLVLFVCQSFATDYDHAQDLFQETWKRAWSQADTFHGGGSFKAWLHRIATNVCLSDRRSRRSLDRRRRDLDVEDVAPRGPWARLDPLAHTVRRDLQRTLQEAVALLPPREQDAVRLRLLEGLSSKEVAKVMGLREATVRSHLRRALRRLRTILEEQHVEVPRYRTTG